jgi:hypothetical protein
MSPFIWEFSYSLRPNTFDVVYKLTWSFIGYTHLVPGRIPLHLQKILNSLGNSTKCQKLSIRMLFHADVMASRSRCRLDGGTFMLRTAQSISSQRCSFGLRSRDCAVHSSKRNSLSWSRRMFSHSSIAQCWWLRAHWSEFFLFLADRCRNWCGKLLQIAHLWCFLLVAPFLENPRH